MLSRIDRAFADRAKTIEQMRRFVGDASHELRTPLVSVRGYAELYRMGALTKPRMWPRRWSASRRRRSAWASSSRTCSNSRASTRPSRSQLAAVDLVPIATTRLSTHGLGPRPDVRCRRRPDVRSGVDAAARAVGPTDVRRHGAHPRPGRSRSRADPRSPPARGVTCGRRSHAATEPPSKHRLRAPMVLAEENKIRQVRHEPHRQRPAVHAADSPIELGVELDGARGLGSIVESIDHGEGIPPQIREKIFQRFWRADSSRNRDTGGSGLGLAIVAPSSRRTAARSTSSRRPAAGRRSGSRFLSSTQGTPPTAVPSPALTPRAAALAGPLPLGHDEIPGRQ